MERQQPGDKEMSEGHTRPVQCVCWKEPYGNCIHAVCMCLFVNLVYGMLPFIIAIGWC